ncbi:hypothetical protein PENSPDRAFT_631515 [Peniophora sp. CONT]|nr:hypothetical protein PENSPDRAFT_631515 [Peniophora sp. CONT]
MFALRSSRQLCRSAPRLIRFLAHESTPGRPSDIRPAESEAWVEDTRHKPTKPESPAPWFLDPEDAAEPVLDPLDETPGRGIPQPKRAEVRPLPEGVPDALVYLHKQLLLSPLIEPSELLVREPITMPLGLALPDRIHGARRKRGSRSMDLGTTLPLSGGGVWDWIVLVQLKEGVDPTRAMSMVMSLTRKSMEACNKTVTLPTRSQWKVGGGWKMVDANDFALHILTQEARQAYFENTDVW